MTGAVDVGLDDAAMLLEPEPHIPDIPDVSIIPEDVDTPDDIDIAPPDDVDAPGTGIVPGSTAAAGAEAPTAVPPPSYMAVDPNVSAGEVATVEHAVLLLAVGMVIVPGKPVGAGLTPADVISVEPRGMPVWETPEPIPTPSGEVAEMVGVGLAISLICATAAALPTASAVVVTAAINIDLMISILQSNPPPAGRRGGIHPPWPAFDVMGLIRSGLQ